MNGLEWKTTCGSTMGSLRLKVVEFRGFEVRLQGPSPRPESLESNLDFTQASCGYLPNVQHKVAGFCKQTCFK